MKGIKIIAAGSAIPAAGYDNETLSRMVDTNDEWIISRTGIRNRHICQEESCTSLAVDAAKATLKHAMAGQSLEMIKEKISAVIVATSTSDYAFPSTACLVAKELGLKKDLQAFDLTAACSGFVFGMDAARNFLALHPDSYVLLIGAEQLSRIIDYTDRSTCILFGDGAGAVLLAASDQIYVHHSGCDPDLDSLNCQGVGQKDMYLHMKGNAVFKFAVRVLQESIDQMLASQQLSLEEIDYVICHQANARIIDHVKKKYPGYEEKFYMNLQEYGNTSAASIPLVIADLMEQKKLRPGNRILCVCFGAGLTWGSTYMQI